MRTTSWAALALLAGAGVLGRPAPARAQDKEAELRSLIEAQNRQMELQRQQIDALKGQLDNISTRIGDGTVTPAGGQAVTEPSGEKGPGAGPPKPTTGGQPGAAEKASPGLDANAVNNLIDTYLKEHPGAGMPPGVQQSYTGNGFEWRSTQNPTYANWEDQSRIPFTLRIRGRIQADWYFYKVADTANHQTGVDTFNNTSADFNQLEVKRARLFIDGTVFDPNLRYNITLDGNTRGLASLANGNGVVGTGGSNASVVTGPTTSAIEGGGVPGGNTASTTDHAVRLFNAFVAYDFHPCGSEKGCSPDCPEGYYRYAPTFTVFAGKVQPFFCLEEILGSGVDQFVEFSMADWFFDADDNNEMTGVGAQVRAFDDRLFGQVMITNGNETQIANLQMDDLKAYQVGAWYDLGGTWNEQAKRWELYGDGIPDVDYSCNPVARVGFATNFVPMDRRSLFTDAELNRVRLTSPAPGGTTILGLLNGGGRLQNASASNVSPFSLDKCDEYVYDVFLAGKYRGFSISNEWWLRNLDNFKSLKSPTVGATATTNNTGVPNPILYTSTVGGSSAASLFPQNRGLIDYGFTLQSGYFLVPRKLEIAGRWSWIRGQSGNINGDGTFTTVNINGVQGGAVRVVNNAFKEFAEANEYAVGLNYYFYRHMVKWQTDFSVYTGSGNPSQGGQSPAGFIPGVNGYMIRSQIQLQF
jgi:hypothetical protein